MERRSLSSAVNSVPNADPEAVLQFVTQQQRSTRSSQQTQSTGEIPGNGQSTQAPTKPRALRSTPTTPIGLIPVTVRLRPELAGALKRASLERQLAGEEAHTQQLIVELALEPWLRSFGYLA